MVPGSMSGLLGAPGIQTPNLVCHHHPGLHQRHDSSPTIQEAEARGRHKHTITFIVMTNTRDPYCGKKRSRSTKSMFLNQILS